MAEANDSSPVDVDRLELELRADPSRFVQLAREYIKREMPVQAIRICKQGLRRNPATPDGRLALAMAYYHNYDDARAEVQLKKVLKSAPDNSLAHRTLGEIYLEREQEHKAIGQLRRALELEPTDRHTRALLESLDEKPPPPKGENGHAGAIWPPRQIHATKSPPKPLWRSLLQVLLVAAGVAGVFVWYDHHVAMVTEIRRDIKEATKLIPRDNYDDLLAAEQWLAQALALDESEASAITLQAQIQSRLLEDHGLTDRLPKLKAMLGWLEREALQVAERYSLEALILTAEGKADQAVQRLDQVAGRALEKKDILLNATVFAARGSAQLALGNMTQAREDYDRAARFSPLSPHYRAKLAEVHLRAGDPRRAIRYFKEALGRNPDHIFSQLRLAYAIIQQGKQHVQAGGILDRLLDESRQRKSELSPPLRAMLYLVRGEYALVARGEGPAEAKRWLDRSLAAWDKSAEAYGLQGRLRAQASDGDGAKASFAKAIELDPRLPKIYFDRAESLFALGEQRQAVDSLEELEQALKPTVAYHVKKGELLMRMDQLDNARAEFEKAIEIDELDPLGHFWLARCYQAMGDKVPADRKHEERRRALFDQARQKYEDAVMRPGGETAAVYHRMGLIYAATQNHENALDNLAKAVVRMTRAGDPPEKIAAVYVDIAKVFGELGGEEGERQARAYRQKAKGLREGKTVDQVEMEEAELRR